MIARGNDCTVVQWQYFIHLLLYKAAIIHIHFNYQEHNSYLKMSLEWDRSIL